ncbi:EAL domain-containing protein [Maricaulis sp.]|uniref:EAL domain-containing protein n=1 Tax=Maricaulis sp. TaxID=1486257 RepID=UPI002602A549|nr:EAL domain-containing protein [Maricaulis sp.]
MINRKLTYWLVVCLSWLWLALGAAAGYAQDEREAETFAGTVSAAQSSMMADPNAALQLSQRAGQLAAQLPAPDRDIAHATAWWLQSEALTRLGRSEEAYPVALRALEQLGENPAPAKLTGDIYTSLGRIEKVLGQHGSALERYQQAYEIYRGIDERRSESIALQSMASIYTDAQQYDRAVEYFENALARYQDPSLDLAAHNNMANALTQLEAFERAAVSFTRARELAREMESPILEARILNNLANMYILAGRYDEAEAAIDEAFVRVADDGTFEWVRFFWGVRAQIAHARGESRDALRFLAVALEGVDSRETNQTFMELHGSAAEIYAENGEWDSAYEHLRAFKRLTDERADFASSANAALMGAQFDFAEQELEIQQLRSASLEQALQLSRSRQRQNTIVAIGVGAALLGAIIFFVMQGRAARARARYLSEALYRDAATGLPTCAALAQALRAALTEQGQVPAVMAFQITRRRQLEGALGYNAFAKLEIATARRLGRCFKGAKVHRLSSGLFGLVAPTNDLDACRGLMAGVLRMFDSPVKIENASIDVSLVAGLAHDNDVDQSLQQLNLAIDRARREASSIAVFDASEYGDPAANLTLMSEMLEATERGEMRLHYQPQFNIRTGRFECVEALCRWQHPERGFIPPDQFIAKAEETGHIKALTEWCLRRVLDDQRRLLAAGIPLGFAVNISATLVGDRDFARRVQPMIASACGPLTLEITETAVLSSPDLALEHLAMWRESGARISIDDYGTGQSSLAYLQRIPSDELKLDRQFVADVGGSSRGRLLVKSTVDLAHNLGLELVAEGVETETELATLKLLGCDYLQGFYLSKPLPLDTLESFLIGYQDMPDNETRQA